MRRRAATPAELDDALAALNAMADEWGPVGFIPVEEPWWSGVPAVEDGHVTADDTPYPIKMHDPPRNAAKSLRFTLVDGRTFDLRLRPGVRIGGSGAVRAELISQDDVRKAYVIESPVRLSDGEPAF